VKRVAVITVIDTQSRKPSILHNTFFVYEKKYIRRIAGIKSVHGETEAQIDAFLQSASEQ